MTPSNAVDLPLMTGGVTVISAGDLAVVLKSGEAVTLPAFSPGVLYPIRTAKGLATEGAAADTWCRHAHLRGIL